MKYLILLLIILIKLLLVLKVIFTLFAFLFSIFTNFSDLLFRYLILQQLSIFLGELYFIFPLFFMDYFNSI